MKEEAPNPGITVQLPKEDALIIPEWLLDKFSDAIRRGIDDKFVEQLIEENERHEL